MGIGDDELDTGQAAATQVAEELGPELLGLAVPHGAAEHLAVAIGADAGGDHDRLGHDPAVDPRLAVGRVEEDVGERLLVQWPGAPGRDLGVELGADPGDLGLRDPGAAHRDHQVIDPTRGDALDVGLHDHRVQGHVDPSAGSQQGREERPGAGLGDLHTQVADTGGDDLLAGPVALSRAGAGALVRQRTDERRRLGVDELLQHRAEQPTHQQLAITALEYLDKLEQGRLIQGHRDEAFREFLGRFSQSLTRWPAYVRDRHEAGAISEPELHHSQGLFPRAGLGHAWPASRFCSRGFRWLAELRRASMSRARASVCWSRARKGPLDERPTQHPRHCRRSAPRWR